MINAVIFDLDQTIADTSSLKIFRDRRQWGMTYSNIHLTVLYDGMKQLFLELESRDIKIGIVTNSPSSYCKKILLYHQLKYDALVGYHDTKKRKPYPDPIYKALEQMSTIVSASVIGLGDEINDIFAYENASIKPIAAMWSWSSNIPPSCENINHPLDLIKYL